jgi:hypothetical protein
MRWWPNAGPRSLKTTPFRVTLSRDLRRRLDKGLHDCHAIKALVKSADDPILRRQVPDISVELLYPAETILFLLPRVITCICFLGRVIERLWIGRLALALVERLDRWLVGGLGRNREVGPETNGAFNLDVLVSIEVYRKESRIKLVRPLSRGQEHQ